jgi:hypothetical protein
MPRNAIAGLSMSGKPYNIKDAEKDINLLTGRIMALEDIIHARDLEIDYLKEQLQENTFAISTLLCMGKKILAQYNKILKL